MENVLLSDLHLGADVCQSKALDDFLKSLDPEKTKRLIIVGDIFDSIDLRRLKGSHWKVLSRIRHLSKDMEVIWLAGNHDGPADIVSHFLGVNVCEKYVLYSGSRQYLILHGHKYDKFIQDRPLMTWIGDLIYWLLQKLDKTHYIARMAKTNSKMYMRCSELIREKVTKEAAEMGCDGAVCGHTHLAEVSDVAVGNKNVRYCNTGCWSELPCTYLTIDAGEPTLHQYQKDKCTN